MAGTTGGRELGAAPGAIGLAGRGDRDLGDIRGGRAVARDGRPMHHAAITPDVPGAAAVEDAAVVPHHDVARLPAVRVDEIRRGGTSSRSRRSVRADSVGMPTISQACEATKNALRPSHGIGPHQRLRYRRHLRGMLGRQEPVADQTA
jgi:hypothetical protein